MFNADHFVKIHLFSEVFMYWYGVDLFWFRKSIYWKQCGTIVMRIIILQNPSFLILSSLKEVSIRLYYQCTAENSVEQDLIILVDCSK